MPSPATAQCTHPRFRRHWTLLLQPLHKRSFYGVFPMTERGRFESVEDSSSYSATSEAAAQAWDKTQFRGQVCSRGDQNVQCVDFDNDDIYNRNAGNHNLRDSSQSLQTAENSIESVLKRLENGNFRGTQGLINQLDRTSDTLDRGADRLKDGIRNLAANSDVEDLIDLADARRDTKDAGRFVDKAIRMLEHGNTRGAARYLRESLEEIDDAQSGIKSGSDLNPYQSRNGRNDGDNDMHDWREPDHRGNRYDNDGRMHDHMYDRLNGPVGLPSPYDVINRVSRGMHENSGQFRGGIGFNPLNPDSVEDFVSNQTGVDIGQLNRAGDQVARIVDPIGALPRPSEILRPDKFLSRIFKI